MKRRNSVIILLFAVLTAFTSCEKELNDNENPVIVLSSPVEDAKIRPGSAIHFEVTFSDNEALASYKVNIHGAFDGHGHSTSTAAVTGRAPIEAGGATGTYGSFTTGAAGATGTSGGFTTGVAGATVSSGGFTTGVAGATFNSGSLTTGAEGVKTGTGDAATRVGVATTRAAGDSVAFEKTWMESDFIALGEEPVSGKRSVTIHHHLMQVPDSIDGRPVKEGHYHLTLYCTDQAGQESYIAREILISYDAEEHQH